MIASNRRGQIRILRNFGRKTIFRRGILAVGNTGSKAFHPLGHLKKRTVIVSIIFLGRPNIILGNIVNVNSAERVIIDMIMSIVSHSSSLLIQGRIGHVMMPLIDLLHGRLSCSACRLGVDWLLGVDERGFNAAIFVDSDSHGYITRLVDLERSVAVFVYALFKWVVGFAIEFLFVCK
jgi:hypothetical protein